jgi:transglutaminase-like putative cysteine protease
MRIFTTLFVATSLLLPALALAKEKALQLDRPRTYNVEFGFTVSSKQPYPDKVQVWLPIPPERKAQKVKSVASTPKGKKNASKTPLLYWEHNQPACMPLAATETFQLKTWRTRLVRKHYKMKKCNTDSLLYKRWTGSSVHINTSDPWVTAHAATLKNRYPDPLDRARAIYDLVLDHLDYKLIDGFGGSKYAIKNKHGECGDYSALFCALCRKAGIPARPVVGYWANARSEAHVWAEFYLQGTGWVPCDPSQGDLGNREANFSQLDNQRVVLSEGFDLEIAPHYPNGRVSIFQVGAYWIKGGNEVKIEPVLRALKQ